MLDQILPVYGQTLENTLWTKLLMGLEDDNAGDGFIDPDPVNWIERHFRIPETSDYMFYLHPYQKAALREALSLDEYGNFKYSVIVWSDIKKSSKSTLAAAVALWRAWQVKWGSIKIIANDLKQADSRVAYYLRRAIELNPEMSGVQIRPSGYQVKFPNKTTIEAVPIDPKGEAGGNDDAVFYSELWGFKNEASKKLWSESTLSPTKFGKSFRWVESYAGFIGESPILENLYDTGVKKGERISWAEQFDPPLECYVNPDARLFCLWNRTPRLPWQTPEYYQQEAGVLLPSEFARMHRNEWSSSNDAFVPAEWWDACKRDDIPEFDPNESIVLAADAATEQDCFGVVTVSGWDGKLVVRFVRAWKPPRGGEILYHDPDTNDGPEDWIRKVLDQYNVSEMTYDPYQLKDMAQRLRQDLVAHLHEFSQQRERAIADKALYDKIRERQIVHNGDPVLREHILNANKKIEGDKMRIVKRNQSMKIDLAVCLSMACERAEKLGLLA